MNKIESNNPKALFIDLNDRRDDNSISEKVMELKNTGYSQVKLEVKTAPEKEISYIKLDIDLFTKIKSIQELPDWVIIRFFLAEGKLKESNFVEQIRSG